MGLSVESIEEAYNEIHDDGPLKIYTKKEVCDRCNGEGYHSNPSLGAFTQDDVDEWYGPDADEFIAEYTKRGGIYDVRCEECNGENVVDVIDEDRTDPRMVKFYHEYQYEIWASYQEQEMERRMGA